MRIAIVAIARLENDYVNEWIGHHLNIGADHIYIYDNSASDEEKISNAIYEKYDGKVTVIPAYDLKEYQMQAYKDSYVKYGKLYDYIAYIDIDEFIMLQKDTDLNGFANRLPADCECYRMNWLIYGDSGMVNRDIRSSVVKDFTVPSDNCSRNTVTKSIIKGGLDDIDFISVHYAIKNIKGSVKNLKTYYGNMTDITESLPVDSKSLNIKMKDYSLVKLNHYMTKTICEFICQKLRRPDAARKYNRSIDADFFTYNAKTREKVLLYESSKTVIKYYHWSPDKKMTNCFENAGDYYNKILMDKLYYCVTKPITNSNSSEKIDLVLCGSVLAIKSLANVKSIIGCGFQNSNEPSNINGNSYLAVRGRLTKERLKCKGVNISDKVKYLDPGLFVSRLYDLGEVNKKYRIGIIPHYVDEDEIIRKYGTEYRIISMKSCDILEICRKIKECDIILSSSLHGIIFSHSLGVPAYHTEFNKLQEGDNFKFKDYYSCFDRKIRYINFKCVNFSIPFEKIMEYDKENRTVCNPDNDEISRKQDEFLSLLPYRQCLRKIS